jgi:hypothetical protein
MELLKTDVLVVGGSTGGTAAAIQAARCGVKTILVSEFPWLGGMLTSAGVSAPDGNELVPFQTGIWGAFLRELRQRQPEGLDHAWVSFFTYDPRLGAQIFADWVAALPNLRWIQGQVPLEVLQQGSRITGVRFADYTIHATITLDGTELGDLLALGDIPHRWGWEFQAEFAEPSAPVAANSLTETYPVQAPTWVVVMQDYGEGAIAAEIPPPPTDNPTLFATAWDAYGAEQFLNYGRLPGNRFMMNWPIRGNDYGEGVERLIESDSARLQFLQESRWHAQSFARYIQHQLGRRYGLAPDIFPNSSMGGNAYALHPYYRESRRLRGIVTLREQDILPIAHGCTAALPIWVTAQGCVQTDTTCDAIAIGNYANDHHYPSGDIALRPKSIRWGGRWTGTPFTIPYRCLIPAMMDGLLVCEKNSSVSHIANGATRLQPTILGIGQAAGMAAALCVQRECQPRELEVRSLQEHLLTDAIAPMAVIPLLNLAPDNPDWLFWQRYYLDHPEAYPGNGEYPNRTKTEDTNQAQISAQAGSAVSLPLIQGIFKQQGEQDYWLQILNPDQGLINAVSRLVTLKSEIHQQLMVLQQGQTIAVQGHFNPSGNWILVESIQSESGRKAYSEDELQPLI